MKAPAVACKVEAYAAVTPSEDEGKVRAALENVIVGADYQYKDGSIRATSRDPGSLSRIEETVRRRKVNRVYRRQMRFNEKGDTTWFYLNKQAAFVGAIALCEEAEESPMGPIKVIIHSVQLDKIVDWLAPEFVG